MLAILEIAIPSLALGIGVGWGLRGRLGRGWPSQKSPASAPIGPQVEAEIEGLSRQLACRYGRLALQPLFESKLRSAYLLRDAPGNGAIRRHS